MWRLQSPDARFTPVSSGGKPTPKHLPPYFNQYSMGLNSRLMHGERAGMLFAEGETHRKESLRLSRLSQLRSFCFFSPCELYGPSANKQHADTTLVLEMRQISQVVQAGTVTRQSQFGTMHVWRSLGEGKSRRRQVAVHTVVDLEHPP